ncbi:MAG TPA: hypothetical protein VM115_13580 [Vicinamibacterales bacterium]|nr:hypothetical protein [Vicinamibacterales bacterium]
MNKLAIEAEGAIRTAAEHNWALEVLPSVMMRGEFFQIKPPFGVD